MTNPLLSICVPVYNQIDLVERLIRQIRQYKGNDIEIIISDDCSADDIQGMLLNFQDKRIKYFRNDENQGHDLNIISSFRRAGADYCFLLRVRDGIIIDNLEKILELIKTKRHISYITGSAVDETGAYRIRYKESMLITDKNDCIIANYRLYIHPSGSIYNVKLLDLDFIEDFVRTNIDTKFSFVGHNLMRVFLSMKGNFYIFKEPTWIYADTSKSKDIAVNRASEGKSVYSTDLIMNRYIAEMRWILKVTDSEELQYICLTNLYRIYLYQITWGQKRRNSNKGIINHYQIKPVKINVKRITEDMIETSHNIIAESQMSQEIAVKTEKKQKILTKKNNISGRIQYMGVCLLDFMHIKERVDHWRNNNEIEL